MKELDNKKSIIAYYGPIEYSNGFRHGQVEASMEIKNQFHDQIAGYGCNAEEATINLYIKLGETIKRSVSWIKCGK